jgi:3-dehydroquinate dehydratase-2
MVINGPNLNLLGNREPEIYGSETLEIIKNALSSKADSMNIDIDFRQSNIEGELVNWIQEASSQMSGIIINAAAFTHTSVAILDAISAADIPTVEVHLSNIFKREEFRHHSFISPVSIGVICGFGGFGYQMALDAINEHLKTNTK